MSDNWATPHEVFNTLDREFSFSFDVCAEHSTAKCPEYWTIEDDALSKNWATDTSKVFGKYLWANPPYSNPLPFVKKAVEAQMNGVGSVMLMNHDMSCEWGSYLLPYVTEIRVIIASGNKKDKSYQNGRLAFIKDGVPVSGNPKGQAIFIFDPYKVGYCHTTYVTKKSLMRSGDKNA